MRTSLALVLVFGFATAGAATGCSAPTDNTMNRMDDTSADPNYPAGPYGYVEGATVSDYKFLGKTPSNGNYDAPLSPLFLSQFHDDPAVRYILIDGSANWCYFCNQEAPNVQKMATARATDGLRTMTVLAEGSIRGQPADESDITDWVTAHAFTAPTMAIDPEGRLFQYAPASAFPVHILLDAKSMKIQWLCVGGIGPGGCDTDGAVSDALDSK